MGCGKWGNTSASICEKPCEVPIGGTTVALGDLGGQVQFLEIIG